MDGQITPAARYEIVPGVTAPLFAEEDRALFAAHRAQTCCFTGHRNIPSKDLLRLSALLDRTVESLFYAGYDTFIFGGARGFDLFAASAVVRLQHDHPAVRLAAFLPCQSQAKQFSESERALYTALLSRSTVYLLQPAYDSRCMRRRNQQMVDCASFCVAYADPARIARSGTGMTLRMAERAGITQSNLWCRLCAEEAESVGAPIEQYEEEPACAFDPDAFAWDEDD